MLSLGGLASAWAEDGHNQTQTQKFAIQGNAQPVCNFLPAQSAQASNMAIGTGLSAQNTLNVNQLVDPGTAQLLPASISVTMKGMCNHPHTITITTQNGGLHSQNKVSPSSAFADHVNYNATVSWGSSVSQFRTSGVKGQGAPESAASGPFAGELRLDIAINHSDAGQLPLIADTYAENLIIKFKPQL